MLSRLPVVPLRLLAGILVVAGTGAIWLGWFGAAGYDWLPAQLPYLISGGLAGLGLVVAGAALFVVDVTQRAAASRAEEFAELRRALAQLLEVPASDDHLDDGGKPALRKPRRKRQAST